MQVSRLAFCQKCGSPRVLVDDVWTCMDCEFDDSDAPDELPSGEEPVSGAEAYRAHAAQSRSLHS
jgi:hypothetical protein